MHVVENMRRILLISSNEDLLKDLRWRLEKAGYFVSVSASLEEPFLEVGQPEASLVILDSDTVPPQEWWEIEEILQWFRHQCPVLLLTSGRFAELERDCDYCLPQSVEKDKLLSCVRDMAG